MQITSLEKEQAYRPLTEGRFARMLRDAFHPVLMPLAKSALTFRIVCDNDYEPLPDRPILFVGNHYCGQDVVIGVNVLRGRVQVVAGKQPLRPVDEFFFNANGTIFVDRKSREDCAACKRAMIAQLRSGQNVLIFPEGTSNVSDELLMYPMKWGVIDAAQQTGAQIIPMVLDYDKTAKECHIRFLPPMLTDGMTLAEGITRLRDAMATARYEFIEKKGIFSRRDMDITAQRAENHALLLSYKLLDYAYERSVVFRPHPTPNEVFAPILKASSSRS